jgi:DNA-binding NtrC family response regulator
MLHAADGRDSCPHGVPPGSAAQLLRLHRHSLINLLVSGGGAEHRERVAREFHRASPLGSGPFVSIDCERDDARVRASLQSWLTRVASAPYDNPLRAAARGTLFLDSIEALSPPTQRLLLMFADGTASGREDWHREDWAGRLIVGTAGDLLVSVAAGRFLAALYDHLDKIRVDLGADRHEGAA